MRINWIGSQFSIYDSYGRYSNGMIRALQGLDVEVRPLLGDCVTMPDWMLQQLGIDFSYLTISCMAALYTQAAPAGTRHWLLSMWETSHLPAHLGEQVNRCSFERIIVPCQAVEQAFRRGGVTGPIHVIPGGVDPDEFPLRDYSDSHRPYTFLAFADRASRKGWLETWDAFYQAFGSYKDTPDVRLIIKCREDGNEWISGGTMTGLMHAPGRDPRITFLVDDVKDAAQMYAQVDCLVFPSRFEGWGLPPREAACMGIPVITQAYSGMDDGHTEAWAIALAPGQMQSILDPDGEMELGEWMKCDIGELAGVMAKCRQSPVATAERGRRAATWLRGNQTWQHAAKQLLQLSNEHGAVEPLSALQAEIVTGG